MITVKRMIWNTKIRFLLICQAWIVAVLIECHADYAYDGIPGIISQVSDVGTTTSSQLKTASTKIGAALSSLGLNIGSQGLKKSVGILDGGQQLLKSSLNNLQDINRKGFNIADSVISSTSDVGSNQLGNISSMMHTKPKSVDTSLHTESSNSNSFKKNSDSLNLLSNGHSVHSSTTSVQSPMVTDMANNGPSSKIDSGSKLHDANAVTVPNSYLPTPSAAPLISDNSTQALDTSTSSFWDYFGF